VQEDTHRFLPVQVTEATTVQVVAVVVLHSQALYPVRVEMVEVVFA
jgi:hypothetical protein